MFTSRLLATLRNTAFGLFLGASAITTTQAAVVTVSASQSSVQLGGSFSLYFDINGLAGTALGGFDLDLGIDSAVLAFTGYSFADNTTAQNQLDLAEATPPGVFFGEAAEIGGVVDAFAVSGNSAAKLDSDQVENFRFLTLHFTTLALSAGTVLAVDLADPFLSLFDASAANLAYSFGSAAATVAVTSPTGTGNVPEPGALHLVLAALAGAALVRSRRRSEATAGRVFVPAR